MTITPRRIVSAVPSISRAFVSSTERYVDAAITTRPTAKNTAARTHLTAETLLRRLIEPAQRDHLQSESAKTQRTSRTGLEGEKHVRDHDRPLGALRE